MIEEMDKANLIIKEFLT